MNEMFVYSVSTLLGTPIQSHVFQYNCYAIKSTFMMPIMLLMVLYCTALYSLVYVNREVCMFMSNRFFKSFSTSSINIYIRYQTRLMKYALASQRHKPKQQNKDD